MATFGNQTTTSSLAISAVNKRGSKFTCPSDFGSINSISAYCDRSASGSGYAVDCAIYTDNAGAPNALVANSAIQISSNIARNTPAWYTGTYGATYPNLTPGNAYWLVALFTKAGLTYYTSGSSNQQGTNADTLPFDDPFGTPSYAAYAMAIYVNYSPASQTYTQTLGIDGYLKQVLTKGPSFDGYLKAILAKYPQIDGVLNKADLTLTPSIDAILIQSAIEYTKTLGLDSNLQGVQTKAVSLDAALNKIGAEKSLSLDAYKQKTFYIYIGSP